MFLHAFFGIALCVACSVVLNANSQRTSKSVDRMDIFITRIFICLQFSRSLLVLLQCLFYEQTYGNIVNTYNRLEVFFVQQMEYRLNFEHFSRDVAIKMTLTLFAFIQFAIVHILITWSYTGFNVVLLLIKLLRFLFVFTCAHLVFSVDALTFYMEQLMAVIARDAGNDQSIDSLPFFKQSVKCELLRNRLKNYKNAQFTLWENSQRLNRFFGWSMVMILLIVFLDSSYTAYWLFYELQHICDMSVRTISEYNDLLARYSICYVVYLFAVPISSFIYIVVGTLILINACDNLAETVRSYSGQRFTIH